MHKQLFYPCKSNNPGKFLKASALLAPENAHVEQDLLRGMGGLKAHFISREAMHNPYLRKRIEFPVHYKS